MSWLIWVLGTDLGPLQKQRALLTAEPSLRGKRVSLLFSLQTLLQIWQSFSSLNFSVAQEGIFPAPGSSPAEGGAEGAYFPPSPRRQHSKGIVSHSDELPVRSR